jgi:hypothetical protein
MAVGLGWLALQRTRRPKMIAQMQTAIENVHLQFAQVREQALNTMNRKEEHLRP